MPEFNVCLDSVLSNFTYDYSTGVLYRITSKGLKSVGNKDRKGYLKTKFKGDYLKIHRLIWFYVYGEFPLGQIDHINGIKTDNRLSNLRVVTNTENQRNQKRNINNKTGVSGVTWHKRDNKWYVNIGGGHKKIYLGSFCDLFEAFCARKSAENRLKYHENHGCRSN